MSMRYRANVAALVTDLSGLLLVCERWGIPGAWQFPQGGVDHGESLRDALARELREEVGLCPDDYEIIASRGGYRYDYPPGVREKKLRQHGHHGQEQTYFHCRLTPHARRVDVRQQPPEFQACAWIRPDEFRLEWVPEFKHEVYRAVLNDFFGVEPVASGAE